MSQKVVIFGTGSQADVVQFYLTHDSDYEVVAFTASERFVTVETYRNLPLVAFEEIEKRYPPADYKMFVAVGYAEWNKVRERFYNEAKGKGYELITYINSKVTHWGDAVIGDNCFILEDVTLQPFVKIGSNNIIWSGNHIGHHSTIGSHCFITSHVVVSGHVNVGDRCFIGVNATLRDNIQIAADTVIGAGALILKNTKSGEIYAGERTKPMPRKTTV
ncbi:MAG: acetyltransferase [Vampirovibrionales bacterium]|nr:acetyltransferase [Vampirovibrionales bacterium]